MTRESILILFRDRSPIYRQCLHRFVEVGREYGYEVIALSPEGTAFSLGEVDLNYYFCVGHDDLRTIRPLVKEICGRHRIRRILVLWEGDVYTASLCREDNGIQGLGPESGFLFRDKNAMNVRAAEAGINIPEWCLPHTHGALERFTERAGYPIVIKPRDGMGCLNTYKVTSPEELGKTWALIRNERHNFRAERFVAGRQFHIDALVQNGRVVFELLSEYTYRLLDGVLDGFRHNELVGSIVRPHDSSEFLQQMLAYNRHLLEAFGLRSGTTHAEFYLTEEGEVFFGEVGARFGGVYIVPLVEHASGLHVAREWAKVDLDSDYYPPCPEVRHIGGVKITSPKRGRIREMSTAEELKKLGSVVDAQRWKDPGHVLGDPAHSADVLGYYICTGDSYEDVYHNLREVYANMLLETEEV